jgi:hypothetical protein
MQAQGECGWRENGFLRQVGADTKLLECTYSSEKGSSTLLIGVRTLPTKEYTLQNTWTRDAKRPGGNKEIVRQRASLQKKVEAKEAKCRRIGVVHQALIAR